MASPSASSPFISRARAPVAKTILFESSSIFSDFVLTSTQVLDFKVASPSIDVILFLFKRCVIPLDNFAPISLERLIMEFKS